jgi:CelD/BcsL family acetyltransferase involved in cellulose biosynthesis
MFNATFSSQPLKNNYGSIEVVVTERDEDFAALEEEWEDLHSDSPFATPFQSWAWLYSWWEHYGEGYELRLVTVREGGLLVGLMPLMLERRGGFRRLLFVGTGLTDYLDILMRGGWESSVSDVARRALQRMDSWQVADLQQLRPEAATWSIFRKWPGPRTCVWQSNCAMIDAEPWNALVTSLARNLRRDVRRTVRRAEGDRVLCRLASVEDAKHAAYHCVYLHREMWRGRHIHPEHLTEKFKSHIVHAAARMTARGSGGISEFWRDGEVIASNFMLFGHNFVEGYLGGASKKALQRYQLSSLGIWDAVNLARNRNSRRVDLGRGDERYKLRWDPRVVPNYRAMLGRSLVFWGPYTGYHILRSKTLRYALVHREDLPQCVKSFAAKRLVS